MQWMTAMLPSGFFSTLSHLDDIAAHQTDFAADGQALELRRRHLGEVLVLDPQLLREGDLAGSGVVGFTVGVVGDVEYSVLSAG